MRQVTIRLTLAAALAVASSSAGAAPQKAASRAEAAAPDTRVEKGVGFRLPAGYLVAEHEESEPGGDNDTVYVARKGAVEVRVEVEDGPLDCKEVLDGRPRSGRTASGLETCEAEALGPPVLGEKVVERRAAMVSVQFPGRHLSIIVFAPDKATAIKVAREVSASGAEVK